MADTPLNDTSWIEILNPPAPEPWLTLPMLCLLLAMLVAIIIVIHYWWRQQPHRRARRQLVQLQQQLHDPHADTKAVIHAIVDALRLGLRIKQLESLPVPASRQADWQQFCTQLKLARFRAQPPDADESHQWLAQAQHWLKLAPRHGRHR